MKRSVLACLVMVACADQVGDQDVPEDGSTDRAEEAKADQADVPVTVFHDDIGARGQSPTRRLFTNAASYTSYFGHAAPASVDFDKEWVVFYSAGVQTSGGYEVAVDHVRLSNSGATLKVTTRLTSPGLDCAAITVLTTPTVLVKFDKPAQRPTSWRSYRADIVHNCGMTATVLKYYFGNQINGSTLEIASDGTITHSERMCCPPHTDPVRHMQLTATELAELTDRIARAKAGTVTTGSYTNALGAAYGTLSAWADGQEVVVREYVPGTQKTNTSAAAGELVQFVDGFVTHDMP